MKWSDGELPADIEERTQYLGPGQLLAPPDTDKMEVTFKLNQCFPGSRYIVTEPLDRPSSRDDQHDLRFAPKLQGAPSEAGATGRTNVFMNGVEGPGPMGFQPSAFDLDAGDPAWSPYWDHFTYAWKDDATPRVFTGETEIHEAPKPANSTSFPGCRIRTARSAPSTARCRCSPQCRLSFSWRLAPPPLRMRIGCWADVSQTVHSDLHSLLCYLFTSQHFMGPGGPPRMDANDAVARRRRFFLGVVSTNPSLSMTLEPARHPTMLPRARVSDSSSCLVP